MTRPPSLTAAEWHALASAVAERDENLAVRAEDHGERTGRERAALDRALVKVRQQLVVERSWGRPRAV